MVTRISGFTSGLDIDTIVKNLMKAKRAPLDKLNQQKQQLEWQREQYRDFNIKMVDLRNNKLFNYGIQGNISAKQAILSGDSGAISAKATSNAAAGQMSIYVEQLATFTTAVGDKAIGKVDTSKTLKQVKDAAPGLFDYTATDGKINLEINGKTIVLDENVDSLNSMVSKINANKEMNVNAYLDAQTGKLSLTSKIAGDGSDLAHGKISATLGSGNLLNNFFNAFDSTTVNPGQVAKLTINGVSVTRTSNTFIENGVEISLNRASASITERTNVQVKANTDSVVDSLKTFIKDYNDLLETANNKINEQRYRNYQPLTTEQKAELGDEEVKLWEDKAKSGLLRRDPTLTSLVDNLRLGMMSDVMIDGKKYNLSQFGIETGDWQQRGKLVIKDEDKLRNAIEADPTIIDKLFNQSNGMATLKADPTNQKSGLFVRLSGSLMTAIDSLAQQAGTSKYSTSIDATFQESSAMSEQLRTLNSRIDDMNARMVKWENAYYKQFTAMEKAMQRYQTQSASFFG